MTKNATMWTLTEHGSVLVGASKTRSNEALTPTTELVDLSVILQGPMSDEIRPTPETLALHVALGPPGRGENAIEPEMVVPLTTEPTKWAVGHPSLVIDLSSASNWESMEVAERSLTKIVTDAFVDVVVTANTARAATVSRPGMARGFMGVASSLYLVSRGLAWHSFERHRG